MKEHIVELTFEWDEGNETGLYTVYTPKYINDIDVYEEIKKTHDFLCSEDEEDIYGIGGRTPETLLSYMCEKKKWTLETIEPDIQVTLS